jgi:HEAT repeat protein
MIGALALEMGLVFAMAAALIAVVNYFTPRAKRTAWNEPMSHWVIALRSPSRAARDSALEAIAYLEPTAASTIGIVLPLLDDPDAELRADAASMLIVVARASEDRAATVEQSVANVLAGGYSAAARTQAAIVLGKTRPGPRGLTAIMSALTDPESDVRSAAIFALAEGGGPATPREMSALFKATHDSEAEVRAAAIESLRRMWPDNESVLSAAGAALEDSASMVREQAIHTLAEFGTRAARYRPRVILASQDPFASVRSAARLALRRMPFVPKE